jgi:hypothetical protein
VEPGSALVGTEFPDRKLYRNHPAGTFVDQGWTAVLAITGDPIDVTNAYLRQARRLGLDHVTGSCGSFRSRPGHYPRSIPLAGKRSAHATAVGCSLLYSHDAADLNSGTSWTFDLTWGDVGGASASAVMSFDHYGDPVSSASPGGRRLISGLVPPSIRTPSPHLIGVGGAIDNYWFTKQAFPPAEVVLVQSGSRLAAPPARIAGGAGFDAVFRIRRDPALVLRRFVRRAPGEKIEDRTDHIVGRTVRTVAYELDGSVSTTFVLTSSPSDSWLLISRSWEP